MIVTEGSADVSVPFYFVDDVGGTAPGEPTTGLLFSDIETGGSASYQRQGAARVDFTLQTLASASAAHADGGFILVDDTEMAGVYRCDIPDAAVAAGVDFVIIYLRAASGNNTLTRPLKIDLNALDTKLDRNADLGESRRGYHTWQGNVYYVDPANGNDSNAGTRVAPRATIQSVHDDLCTDSNHDVIVLVAGEAAGVTTHSVAATTTISKRYVFLRGPGRDFVITRTGAGDTIAISADGIEISGVQIGTAATGAGNGITITDADFHRVHNCWFLDTQGDGIHVLRGSNTQIHDNNFEGTGVGGSGQGIHIAGTAGSSNENAIYNNHISNTGGDSIRIENGTTLDTTIHHNAIHNAGGWGINIGASSTDALIHDNVFGNNASGNITDAGTTTIQVNNEQWAKQSLQVYGNFAVHIDTVGGTAGSVEGINGRRGNPVDNLADAVTLAAGLGVAQYHLHGGSAVTLVSAHQNWMFRGQNGASVDAGGQNISGSHFECLTLTGDADGNDITARYCKLQSLTNLIGTFEFCMLVDNVTVTAGDHYFFLCASAVAGTATPYVDVDGDDTNARNVNLRGFMGGIELRNQTSTDSTSYDCLAGQLIVASSCTGGVAAIRGSVDVTDNSGGAVFLADDAALNMTKINAVKSFFRKSRGATIEASPRTTDNSGIGAGDGAATRTLLNAGHMARITKSGTVTGAIIEYGTNTGAMTSVTFQAWRWTGSGLVFDEVGSSEAITADMSDDTDVTYAFVSPITGVQAGDMLSVKLITSGTVNNGIDATTGLDTDDAKIYYIDSAVSGDGVDFSANSVGGGAKICMSPLMQSPTVVIFGDSFLSDDVAGPESYLWPSDVAWTAQASGDSVAELLRAADPVLFDVINAAQGSTTSANWITNLPAYVELYQPRFAIFTLGVNDIAGAVSLTTFQGNIKSITHALSAVGIVPVILSLPHITTAQVQARAWSDWLQQYAAEIQVPFVDVRAMAEDYETVRLRDTDEFGSGTHGGTTLYEAMAAQIHAVLIDRGF